MNTFHEYGMLTGIVSVNLAIVCFIYLYLKKSYETVRINEVKKSMLSVEINSVMDKWKERVKIVPLADGRIKVDFPEPIMEIDLYFYLSQEDGKVIISDHGELVGKYNMNRTMNKTLMKKLSGMFGLVYNHSNKCLYLETTIDKLDECMWTMFFAIILLEYATY